MTWHAVKLFVVVAAAVGVLDAIWLGQLMTRFYDRELGEIARRSGESLAPRWAAAMIVYVLIPLSIVTFVRPLHDPSATIWAALGCGALLGACLYGVYDFTNLATLARWSWRLALVDTAWGATLCGLASMAGKAASWWWTSAPPAS